MRFRPITPSQIVTLTALSGVDILEAYKGFGIDVREVPAVKAQKLIDKLREAEERRERQRVNRELATWFGVITR